MPRENLKEKIADLLFWTVVFFIAYLIVGFCLESSWLNNSVSPPKIYEILKDDLSITAALLAPAAALLLFSDWKEQHILTLVDAAARKISEDIHDLQTLTVQAYYKEPLEVSDMNIKLQEHPFKGSLFDLRRSIEINEKIIKNSGMKCSDLLANIYFLKVASESLENTIRKEKYFSIRLEKIKKSESYSVFDLEAQQLTQHIRNSKNYFDKAIKEMGEQIKVLERQLQAIQI